MQGGGIFYEANNTNVIHCLCSKGHIIFPLGISFKTLYKNHNQITIHTSQNVKPEWLIEQGAYEYNSRHTAIVDNKTKKEYPTHLLYLLTDEQEKRLKVKCPTCHPFCKK